MSVKQNLFVSVFVHECLMMLNDVQYTPFKMFVTQMSNYLFVISFQLMFYKTLRYRLARALHILYINFRSDTYKHYPRYLLADVLKMCKTVRQEAVYELGFSLLEIIS